MNCIKENESSEENISNIIYKKVLKLELINMLKETINVNDPEINAIIEKINNCSTNEENKNEIKELIKTNVANNRISFLINTLSCMIPYCTVMLGLFNYEKINVQKIESATRNVNNIFSQTVNKVSSYITSNNNNNILIQNTNDNMVDLSINVLENSGSALLDITSSTLDSENKILKRLQNSIANVSIETFTKLRQLSNIMAILSLSMVLFNLYNNESFSVNFFEKFTENYHITPFITGGTIKNKKEKKKKNIVKYFHNYITILTSETKKKTKKNKKKINMCLF